MSRGNVDVSALPDSQFGHKGLIWWGTVGFMVIEGSMFIVAFVTYFYLRLKVDQWPPSLPNPAITFGTINLIVLLASCVPNQFAKWAAERCDINGVRLWLSVLCVVGVASTILRAFEYPQLNCRWDDNAYASIVWVLLSMHTMHLATDTADSIVLLAMAFRKEPTRKRFVDFSENALYWYFIVFSFVPVYLTIYLGARWL
jgi:cytochrome c oxidase subunit III